MRMTIVVQLPNRRVHPAGCPQLRMEPGAQLGNGSRCEANSTARSTNLRGLGATRVVAVAAALGTSAG